ncbi:hybrid sensor histidine kinase/response regulator [Rhodocaloribacter sp.]
MPDPLETLTPIEPELFVATFSPEGEALFRNEAWGSIFGEEENPWARFIPEDRTLAGGCVREAGRGSLVTNQLFLAHLPDRDEPLPVLLHFLPVHTRETGGTPQVRAVTVMGEALAEPNTWTPSQTQRHRMETLGRMTMGIAHDFNNLLSSVLGHIELLKSAPPGKVPPALLREHLNPIEQAALDGAALVSKIQQYIRQEKETVFEPLDLPTLIRDATVLTKPYWYNDPRRRGIAIDLDLDLAPVPPIMGAAAELRDVLVNLILNAVHAMPRGGSIRFETRDEGARGVVLRITDSGTGMTENVRAHIFEPLFTTKGKRGTGMGLAVSYGIIQEHDGSIEVASEPGVGTTFTLTFPPAETAPAAPAPEAETPSERHARILVVDDERGVRTVLCKMLALRGHTAVEAASGAEALALIEREAFDLVFTDQGMPEMSGRQLARALRRRVPDLPIVLITGDTEAGAPDEHVNLVLGKPFKLEHLDDAVRRLLD